MNTLQIVKSLKLSFDQLGYAVFNSEVTTNRQVYRKYLRSGKIEPVKQTSDNRVFQTNNFYTHYFKTNKNPLLRCDYKEVVKTLLNLSKGKNYYKSTVKVSNQLLKYGYFESYILSDAVLLKDNINNNTFYYCGLTKNVYRLVNNKNVIYKLK
mgnify:CR=1 FL=1